ncbi:MAG: purine-binding chemotaxis protein CheW [Clostridia bacterium]|nr:purine-binding chemotaxis protein CheW [Clostridia bacterium]
MDKDMFYEEMIEDTQKNRFLTFSLEKEHFGIEILYVTEIVGIQPITTVPEMPEFIKGIINLRGEIIPVMDARIRFKKPTVEYTDRTCIIVLDVKDISVGIIVDAVNEVSNISEENIVPPPIIFEGSRKYIKAIGKKSDQVILLLDCNHLLNDEEVASIMSV